MPHVEKVKHVVQIERWRFDYMFGIDETSHRTGPYYDIRHIQFAGPILEPKGVLKATHGEVICFPDNRLIGASEQPIRKFGDRLGSPKPQEKIRPAGRVSYRGKNYSAHLDFPSDMLHPILTMLSAGRYRYVIFEAAKGSRDAEIYNFYFSDRKDEDDSAAGWDDV
ncbi:hypothetical protein [Bradyrhizobium sp. Arg816]|uniref:hypothetical protein n=1 Tax=Bradyrhizobium sp. Arg816 TaxID=2998491 RepID=UPI00249EE10F|nr:hypothetical protein [Bradyrhizobium sp. Arg816]MDI3564782.1 hypothetical protein [Bradyrhizobium sp. Arg816]